MTLHTIILKGRRSLAGIAAVSTLAFLSGCMVGPNYKRPAVPASEQYDPQAQRQLTASGAVVGAQHISLGQKIDGNWWAAFDSTKLDQMMHQVIDGNLDLAAASATIAEANEAVLSVKGGLYPQIDYGGQIGYQRSFPPGSAVPFTTSYHTVGLFADYDFDVFGGIKRQIERQAALADFQKRQYDAVYLTLTGDIANQAILLASMNSTTWFSRTAPLVSVVLNTSPT